ncbi:AEC family transporter [Hydrogenophaga crocea]|uniref:AEC family transporter n=1 Tax=Hydrogenophaga crocea TaxID=2716225 RepID=A0A6G8IHF7_9BURK|nr:AEC family transporter [Hydrogenophaga crocea]QIM52400.1 AEC family transporter [Hydrogenophaga crocea]
MDLIARIAEIIVPVFLIVAIGYGYARRKPTDLVVFNRIALDVLAPLLVYTALASRDFDLDGQAPLLVAGTVLILGCGLLAWPLSRATGAQARTLVPVVMFNNCGNMGLPLALLAFGPAHFGAAVALFSVSNLLHFSIGARITSRAARTRDLLTSPLMIATVLGFFSAFTELRPPALIASGMKLLGEASLPLLLFALGVRLTGLTRQGLALGLLGAVARPLIGLGLAIPLAWALQLEGAARGQLLLFSALPPAVIQYMLADRYQQEPEKVAASILVGNALAVVFVPLALALAL